MAFNVCVFSFAFGESCIFIKVLCRNNLFLLLPKVRTGLPIVKSHNKTVPNILNSIGSVIFF